jgi:hypothetical protein
MAVIAAGSLSTALIEGFAIWLIRLVGTAPHAALERREWHHAFWWSVFPNLMLIGTAYLMLADPW